MSCFRWCVPKSYYMLAQLRYLIIFYYLAVGTTIRNNVTTYNLFKAMWYWCIVLHSFVWIQLKLGLGLCYTQFLCFMGLLQWNREINLLNSVCYKMFHTVKICWTNCYHNGSATRTPAYIGTFLIWLTKLELPLHDETCSNNIA